MYREMVVAICSQFSGSRVVGATGNGEEALALCLEHKPDLIVLDLQLEDAFDGFEIINAIAHLNPRPKIVIMTAFCDDYSLLRAHRAEVDALLAKEKNGSAYLYAAISALREGRKVYSEPLEKFRKKLRCDPRAPSKLLTDREELTLRLCGRGLCDAEIAEILDRSVVTVRNHVKSVMKKLSVESRASLVHYALCNGYARVKATSANQLPTDMVRERPIMKSQGSRTK